MGRMSIYVDAHKESGCYAASTFLTRAYAVVQYKNSMQHRMGLNHITTFQGDYASISRDDPAGVISCVVANERSFLLW